ncbi:hypothetical protein HD598_001135 [Neomicrococcus aestuarii]|uniref:Uncharacterized protein n=1 Tax=Neomicrococcus aestuarii TaxID=556325 RepID=A0A7W8X029_9MICC|nr:hypothetical protein [Neomicrococcus aestuarii]MBB5512448.1 hypothetical protein [Neomicrococcus aestuarii]
MIDSVRVQSLPPDPRTRVSKMAHHRFSMQAHLKSNLARAQSGPV